MPRAKTLPVERSCAECGASFSNTRRASFCSAEHHRRFNNRRLTRGAVILPFVMAWIEGKGGGHTPTHATAGPAMREVTQIVRGWIDEDRAAGRPSMIPYVEALFAEGLLYCDRRRHG